MTNKSKNEISKKLSRKTKKKTRKKTTKKELTDTIRSLKSTIQDLGVEKQGFVQEVRKTGLRTALIAVVLLVISMSCLYLTAYNNQMTSSNVIFGMMFGVVFGGIFGIVLGVAFGNIVFGMFGGIVAGIFGGIIFGIVGGFFSGMIGGFFGGIAGGIADNISNNKKKSVWTIVFLGIIFLLPFTTMIIPLSKYHNQNQIERDKKIVGALQIIVQEDGIEILLPNEHTSENGYLEKVLSVGLTTITERMKTWKEIVIPCREGDKNWYKANLASPDCYKQRLIDLDEKTDTARLILFFDHAWMNYETTKEISFPDPNHSL